MRLKKQKRHRKIVSFYSACFSFRQPFKVLCDGTFVHHLIVNRITPADTALSDLLGASVNLFTTRCVLAELKKLGEAHSESFEAAHQLMTAKCDHERKKNADACIMEIIGKDNQEHFFVATQDTDLRKKFQEVPGVPIIFGLRNALFLEPPSAFQRQFVKASEEERLHMTQLEYKMLKKRVKNGLTTEEVRDTSDEDKGLGDQKLGMEAVTKRDASRKGMGVKDRPQFKRKKAKAPNPLSRKKKKSHQNPNPVSDKGSKDGDSTLRSRSRKRKRSRKGNKPVETVNASAS